jgi:hypothetical protein
MFSITYKTLGALSLAVFVSACSGPIVIPVGQPEPAEPGPVLPATQPFPPEVSAALPADIPASAVKIQDGCYFYRFGDDIRPVSFDGTNPVCPAAATAS